MTKESYSFDKLPFSQLFKTYLSDFSRLQDFYCCNPFDEQQTENRATRINKAPSHHSYTEALSLYHEQLNIDQHQQLQKLSDEKTLAIVTGQQLGIYGGPVFTIYKTLTTILLAEHWEKKLQRPVVPVFWLADEDHDFEEVAWFGIPGNEALEKVIYETDPTNFPVSEYQFDGELGAFRGNLKEHLYETDFSAALWEMYDGCYKSGGNFASAFAQMMDKLFGKYGLLIAGSHFGPVKNIVADTFARSISESETVDRALKEKTEAISAEFHAQVTLGDSNLFYMCGEQGRIKIESAEKGWKAGEYSWDQEELLKIIEEHPERFSPNVFLRPVIQDQLLPTLGYVAGPGEVAYYAQMKDLYPVFGLEMPVIFPRMSATLLESAVERILEKLPFEWFEFGRRIEDLETEYVERTETHDIESLFGEWEKSIESVSEEPKQIISEIDGSLEGMVGSTISGFTNELNKLKGRVYRSVKQQEQTQLNRIRRAKAQLYPDGGLQERQVSFMYFMNKYGTDLWDQIYQTFDTEELDLRSHHVISL